MHCSNFTTPVRNIRSSRRIRPGLLSAAVTAVRWLGRKIGERRNYNALMELSDDQLKDVGLSRGQQKATCTFTAATETSDSLWYCASAQPCRMPA